MTNRRIGIHSSRSPIGVFVALMLISSPVHSQDFREPSQNQIDKVRVAAISFVPKKFDLKGNADHLERAFRAAHKGEAQIAVAPEGALDGYVVNEIIAGKADEVRMNDVAVAIDDPVIKRFQELARELRMCLVFGFAERIDDDVFNCAVFIDHDGRICGKYHKMQLAEGYHSSWWFNRLGRRSRAFDTPHGRCGILICNDRWNPQLSRIPVLDGAQYLLIPAFGSRSKSQDEAVLSRAKENNVSIVEANVGVTLVIDRNQITHADRREHGITFGEISIPAGKRDVTERDRIEKQFLDWRVEEMRRRYEQTLRRVDKTKSKVKNKRVTVGAYYYPWYRAYSSLGGGNSSVGWMSRALRGRLKPPQLPKLGIYDSRDPKVIAEHIAQSKRANISFWAVSWWGPDRWTDKTFGQFLLSHPDSNALKFAVLYESTGRLGSFDDPGYANLIPDVDYLAENYFNQPNYLRIDGKPVVFVYLTRVYFRDRGIGALADLRQKHPDLFLVGDDVFGPRYRAEWAKPWDAVTAYDVYGQSLQIDNATRAAVERLQANYTSAPQAANSVGVGFVPAISPGFNDRAVRRGHGGRVRYFVDASDSREGDVFREMIHTTLPLADSRTGKMIMVTSFNEWYEDTQIEATVGNGGKTDKDDSASGTHYVQNGTYSDYGNLYLDILREETKNVVPEQTYADTPN